MSDVSVEKLNETGTKASVLEGKSSRFSMRLGGKILSLVLIPVVFLSLVNAYTILSSSQRLENTFSHMDETLEYNRRLTIASGNMTDGLLKINSSVSGLDETRRANIQRHSYDPQSEIGRRNEVRDAINAYFTSIIRFSAIVEQEGLHSTELDRGLHYLIRSGATLGRLNALYTTANSRTLRLIRDGDFEAARNNYNFEERARLGSIQKLVNATSHHFTEVTNMIATLVADAEHQTAVDAAALQRKVLTYSFAGLAALTLVILASATLFARRNIINPIRLIPGEILNSDAKAKTSSGAGIGSSRNDEIGDVLTAVETMRRRTLEKRAQEEQKNAERDAKIREQQKNRRLAAEAEEKRREQEEAEAKRLEDDKLRQQEMLAQAESKRNLEEQAEVVRALARGLSALSEGNLSDLIDTELAGEYDQLRKDFNAAAESLSLAISQIQDGSVRIRADVNQIAAASDDLARRTEMQAATLEETAAALDQVTASVRSTADGAGNVSKIVDTAQENAKISGQTVQRTVEAMDKINTSSSEIQKIITVIDDISFQTNLLALNAGVEAARAGPAGRGFAVVASEVRALAQRSSAAAAEIGALISNSGTQVRDGVEMVEEVQKSLKEIVTSVQEVATHVTEMSASSVEQATGLAEINTAINNLDGVTQKNAAMFEETNATTQSLMQECEVLSGAVSRFSLIQDETDLAAEGSFTSVRGVEDRSSDATETAA
ncbi:methyl-accepting chemotaxis protein [Halocynthiibacter sp.]|uniref:methyl-accepting chemotaxis protein n=1 Tax=Halocynthiibacter sp. TaxID=1979210 RepID=UPI003C5C7CE6